MSCVLITGGAGFIGSHLAERFVAQGFRAKVLDNFSTGRRENLATIRSDLRGGFRLDVIEGSVLSRPVMDRLVAESDCVVHLAAAVGVRYVLENRLEAMRTNVQGTENTLDACARFDKPVLIASSSEVYGRRHDAPLHEDSESVLGPSTVGRWSYAAAKLTEEFSALAYRDSAGLRVTIARLFNVVGPRQSGRYGMVLPRFVRSAIRQCPLEVFGDGSQTRTFTHVHDATRVLLRLSTGEFAGEVFNVGGRQEVSIGALAERVVALAGSDSEIITRAYHEVHREGEFEDIPRRVPSISKVRQRLGYAPKKGLDSMITDVLAFERSRFYMSQKASGTDSPIRLHPELQAPT